MIGITGQWDGATLLTNGVLLLDPCAFLVARGVDLETLDPAVCNLVMRQQMTAAGVPPPRHIVLVRPELC